MSANIINHIVLVLDASSSMQKVSKELIKVADNQIKYLATRSQDLDQETRITVYSFSALGFTGRPGLKQTIECLIYDMDVLRVPSIANLYKVYGSTPLIDATFLALDDLAMTPEKYGEHSFLVYVLTDGQENASNAPGSQLQARIETLPDHWTVAAFVPNQVGVHEAKRFGFPAQNISVWDTTSAGISEVGAKIRETTDNFMVARSDARASGVSFRGTKNLFTLNAPKLATVATTLKPLERSKFQVYPVMNDGRIDDFVSARVGSYKRGTAYYQLTKREEIQPQKSIAIMSTRGVYVGAEARRLLGLPNEHVRVSPNQSAEYEIFVQSTSDNRKLIAGTKLLLIP